MIRSRRRNLACVYARNRKARTMEKLAGIAVCLLGFAAASAAFAQDAETQGVTDKEVSIGQMGPFAGPAYLYGRISINGAEAVFDQVNETGGIAGRKLVL